MNKLIKIILISSIAIFSAGILFIGAAQAKHSDNLVVEYWSETENNWLPLQDSIFSETNILPGSNMTRLVKVTNKSNLIQKIATEAINYPGFISGAPRPHPIPDDDLSRALSIIIREEGGSDLYGGLMGGKTLYDFYQNGETYLSNISGKSEKTYEFVISFPETEGNYWNPENTDKRPTTSFDILVGFQGDKSGGGGGIPLPPGLTIQNEATIKKVKKDSVTITWLTSYFSTSQVIYDTEKGKFDLSDPPKFGYANIQIGDNSGELKVTSHSVTLTGLKPKTTYYYRAVSYASPPTISLEYVFVTPAASSQLSQKTEPPENQQKNDAIDNDELKISDTKLPAADSGIKETLVSTQGIGPGKKSTAEEVKVLGTELDQIDSNKADQADQAKQGDSGVKADLKPEVKEITNNYVGATAGNFKKWLLTGSLLVIIVIEIIYLITKRRKQ